MWDFTVLTEAARLSRRAFVAGAAGAACAGALPWSRAPQAERVEALADVPAVVATAVAATAVAATATPATPATPATGTNPSNPVGSARIVEFSRNRNKITLYADAKQPAWVVLADQNYPGWTATVDDQPERIYTADYLLRAVPVSVGYRKVVFTFVPTNYGPTLALSIAALAVIAIVILFSLVQLIPPEW